MNCVVVVCADGSSCTRTDATAPQTTQHASSRLSLVPHTAHVVLPHKHGRTYSPPSRHTIRVPEQQQVATTMTTVDIHQPRHTLLPAGLFQPLTNIHNSVAVCIPREPPQHGRTAQQSATTNDRDFPSLSTHDERAQHNNNTQQQHASSTNDKTQEATHTHNNTLGSSLCVCCGVLSVVWFVCVCYIHECQLVSFAVAYIFRFVGDDVGALQSMHALVWLACLLAS